MTDERIFTVKINGLSESYKDVVKLRDVLHEIQNVQAKVTVETDKANKATEESNRKSKEKTKALTEEEKAEKKLAETRDKASRVITQMERDQVAANQQLRERTRSLGLQVQAENAATNSIEAMRVELSRMKDEWKKLDVDSTEFEELSKTIDELNEKIKQHEQATGDFRRNVGNYESATKGIEETLQGLGEGINQTVENTKGMLSLFQAGVGALAVFGDESESTTKLLSDLGKIMAIVGALQAANNILLTKGAVASKGAAIMEGIHALQIRARAISISLATKNTIAATAAQWLFNAAANANPYVLLAVALITVVGALVAFSLGTQSAAEKQSKLNDLVKESISLKDSYADYLKKMADVNVKGLERELNLLKARGASEAQIAQKQRQILEERVKLAEKMRAYYADEIDSISKNSRGVEKYTMQIKAMNDAISLAIRDGKNMAYYRFQGVDYKVKIDDKSIEEARGKLQEGLNKVQIRLDQGLIAKKELDDARSELDNFNAETERKGIESGKRNAQALAEYRVLMAQKGSKDELIARIAAANQQLKNDLSNAEITKGERLKRTKETLLQIEKLESDYRSKQLQDTIDLIDIQLDGVKKGSSAEYSLTIDKLKAQKNADLENTELTATQRLKIESKYNADVEKLSKEYTERMIAEGTQTQIASINARLATVRAGSSEEYEIRKELAEQNAQLSKDEAESSIENEALKAAKIKEINANLQKELQDIDLSSGLAGIDSLAAEQTANLLDQLMERKINRREYEEASLEISYNALKEEIDLRKKMGENTVTLENELSEMGIKVAENHKNKVGNQLMELHDKMKEYADKTLSSVGAVFDGVNSLLQSQVDEANDKLNSISEKYDEVVEKREESNSKIQELEDKAKNARGGRALILRQQIDEEMQANRQLADQEKQLAKDKEKQEKEIAKKERQQKKIELGQKIAQAIADTALGVVKAIAASPLTFGLPWSAFVAGAGALQVGVMVNQLAKLEDGGLLNGKRHSQGGMRIEGTNIEVEGDEFVVNRESTKKNLPLIQYINSQRRELAPTDLNSFFSRGFEPPFKRMLESGGQLPTFSESVNTNNEIIAEAIRAVKIEPVVSVTDINRVQNGVVRVKDLTDL